MNERIVLKKRDYPTLALLIVIIIIVAVSLSASLVSADPCLAQLNYPIMPVVYSNSNVPIVVPVSVSCTTYYGSQLYVTGKAYDTSSNIGLGSVSSTLQSVNGGTTFNGQLGFNLPPSTQGHSVQVSVSIYNNQYGNLITATSETFQVESGNPQVSTITVTQVYPYPFPNQYPYLYPNQYSASSNQYPYPSPSHRHWRQPRTQNIERGALFDYVAIAAILAAVIIASAGLAVYGRRQPNWIPIQSPPQPS
jgi:hypothetical protein